MKAQQRMKNILRQISYEYTSTVLGKSYRVPLAHVLFTEILWIRRPLQMWGTEINFHVSSHSGIIERWKGTTRGVSSNSQLRAVLIRSLDQVLVQMSSEHLQGWILPGPSRHLCQCWTTLGGGEHILLTHSQNFPCCKLCLLSLALCCSAKNLDQS